MYFFKNKFNKFSVCFKKIYGNANYDAVCTVNFNNNSINNNININNKIF